MELDLSYFSSFVAFSTITYLPLGVRVRSEKKYAGEAVTDEIIIIKNCSGEAVGNPSGFPNLKFLCGNGNWHFFISSFC